MRQRKVCPKGHVFFKTSACPTCPRCEAARKPKDGFLAELAAPARRALENAGLTTLAQLSKKSETEVSELHGMGTNAIAKLRGILKKSRLRFAK
jgi:predicted RecB family nuclease